jgi:predicted Zn finger-like uncharacterized protein
MIVQCEQCGTKYRFDTSKIGAGGIKVKCSKCKHIFKVFHPLHLEERDIFGEDDEKIEGPSIKEWENEFTTKPPPKQTETIPQIRKEEPPPKAIVPPLQKEKGFREKVEAEEASDMEEEVFPFRATIPREAPAKRERKVSTTFLLSILLIVVILAAFYYLAQKESSIPVFESIHEKISNLMGEKKDHKLFLIYLRGYEQKLEGGKVYIIQGKVANRSKVTKKYVKLKGVLFDKEGKIVASSIGYCGRTTANKEIKESTFDSLKSTFNFISPAQAPQVPSQQSLPFTIVFFSPPSDATEFRVEIIEAPSLT